MMGTQKRPTQSARASVSGRIGRLVDRLAVNDVLFNLFGR